MSKVSLLFLSKEDVVACAPSVEETRKIVEDVFKAHAAGKVVMPTKVLVKPPEPYRGHWNAMPAFLQASSGDIGGIKWLSSYLHNLEMKLPNIVAIIVINDPTTGFPLAIMDGTYITGLRTAAAVAGGAKYLARLDSNTVAIIGTSVQGRFQLGGICEAFDIKRVVAYDIVEETLDQYISEMSLKAGIEIERASSHAEAVLNADIVINATRTKEPFFRGEWCRPGMLIVSIGSRPELMEDVVERADKIVVDDWEGCKHLGSLKPFAEKGIVEAVYAEIGEVVGLNKPGRQTDDEIIVYVPMGMGTEDMATAYKVYRNAIATDRGLTLDFCGTTSS
jgi:ornithine cyclodeaminase/alanine dehydrogenase-like protein (mu-crystallin family)